MLTRLAARAPDRRPGPVATAAGRADAARTRSAGFTWTTRCANTSWKSSTPRASTTTSLLGGSPAGVDRAVPHGPSAGGGPGPRLRAARRREDDVPAGAGPPPDPEAGEPAAQADAGRGGERDRQRREGALSLSKRPKPKMCLREKNSNRKKKGQRNLMSGTATTLHFFSCIVLWVFLPWASVPLWFKSSLLEP